MGSRLWLQSSINHKYRKYFLSVPTETVRHTFDSTTRYYRHIPATNHMMTYRSPYPGLNVLRRHELVAAVD